MGFRSHTIFPVITISNTIKSYNIIFHCKLPYFTLWNFCFSALTSYFIDLKYTGTSFHNNTLSSPVTTTCLARQLPLSLHATTTCLARHIPLSLHATMTCLARQLSLSLHATTTCLARSEITCTV